MRNLLIASVVAFGTVLAGATVASANTSVYNRYENKHIYNGHSETNIHSNVYEHSNTITNSQSIKVETYGGDINQSIVTFDGNDFNATAISTNQEIVDPVAIISVVEQNDFSTETAFTNIDVTETYNFSGSEREHEVGNRF